MSLRVGMIMSLAFLLVPLAQADTVTISQSTPFAENSGASENVKKECGMESRLPKYLKDYAK